jgi:2-oxoglutarate ferredoxin oxidoreductase subunit alpha
MGHGDSDTIVLMPGDMNECFDFGWQSFDIAERLQTPVIILADLDMGMNQWMSKPFEYPKTPMDRGKFLLEKDIEELKGNWGRYLDKDGDGIPYRTFPGNKHPLSSYFTRGTGHDEHAKYTEDAGVFHRNMMRLKKKFVTAKQYMPKPVVYKTPGAKIAIIAYGSTESAVIEARDLLGEEQGINADFLRVRSVPFTQEVDEFVENYDQIFVVEMNRDGQLHQLLSLAYPQSVMKLKSVAFGDGMPASAKWIREGILSQYVEPATAKPAKKGAK